MEGIGYGERDNGEETMKVFITKYALNKGIIETDAEYCASNATNMIVVRKDSYSSYYHWEGTEWHRTREAAVARAEQMRLTKIKSLKQQIERLEKLRFSEGGNNG